MKDLMTLNIINFTDMVRERIGVLWDIRRVLSS